MLDISIALLLLMTSLPVMVLLAGAVAITVGRPVFFRQVRIGLYGQPFVLVKFRTMRAPIAGQAWFSTDQVRLTRFGALMRRLSLDELPQLWHVLRGEMSLVGPRPLIPEYLPLYSERQRLRHRVRPGLTGWAQVRGRNRAKYSERFALDVWYTENWSLLLDAKILLLTAIQAVTGDGVVTDGVMAKVDDLGFEQALQNGAADRLDGDHAD